MDHTLQKSLVSLDVRSNNEECGLCPNSFQHVQNCRRRTRERRVVNRKGNMWLSFREAIDDIMSSVENPIEQPWSAQAYSSRFREGHRRDSNHEVGCCVD